VGSLISTYVLKDLKEFLLLFYFKKLHSLVIYVEYLLTYLEHRRKELYGSDAEVFRPERWDKNVNNEVNLKNIGWGYLPFNGGPRVCIGRKDPSACPCSLLNFHFRGICPPRSLLRNHQTYADIL
jgi:hypothetical protein